MRVIEELEELESKNRVIETRLALCANERVLQTFLAERTQPKKKQTPEESLGEWRRLAGTVSTLNVHGK